MDIGTECVLLPWYNAARGYGGEAAAALEAGKLNFKNSVYKKNDLLLLQILKLTEDLEQATLEKNQLSAREALLEENEIQLMREQIFGLEEEKSKLQQQLETLQKDQSQESHQLVNVKICSWIS